ncbi:hypothetical protein [Stenotrophomonas acidaminiphila]|uniref:hypothetical protein n=1 Tax=Stenotrophomonas acidaminiphila TaxID=128780 RepID=UPI001FAFC47A|nr:hypothetical protein [Stenotrophomonas acidaminiphila]
MGLVEKIASRAGLMVERRGSLRPIQSVDALAFLDQCEAEGFRVLGIEGFARKQGALIPDMDAIADFSDAPGCSILEAKRSVAEVHASSLMLDFAVE